MAICDLSIVLHDVMVHNSDESFQLGSDGDLRARMALYAKLRHFGESLPDNMQLQMNTTPQTCYLRYACLNIILTFS
jgi:hypothetical protein